MSLSPKPWASRPKRRRLIGNDLTGRLRQALLAARAESSDFDLNPPAVPATPPASLRRAGVLIVITDVAAGQEGAHIVLTKRASGLRHHPGQIAFPGGKVDPQDGDETQAALREAREEIGLPPDNVEVLGSLPAHVTVTGFVVTPVLSILRKDFEPVPEAGEVDEIFRVPLEHVLRSENYSVQSRHWRGQERFYYALPTDLIISGARRHGCCGDFRRRCRPRPAEEERHDDPNRGGVAERSGGRTCL